ncbi:dTMP kinase [Apilactobacillus ozensis]|uniref:Thymidylate kinase n=1 Tax=Apilactobacillus ozensis DSM 23829 = JCM 17196 TaxID=1423781 RepID=A0A0R2ARH3_9LACO|nr:dTMP kinase [Apilactobacillus ozensis]KRM69456.1 thymidylate kinase [Apilactobacillus ozensis DSM 23829 = JCM 17196]MCK8607602.1 dTMP kinase [Apilactobacillus ozensis]
MRGKFITFEGPDGAGKTTVMNEVLKFLNKKLSDDIVFSREPGGNNISEQIRNIILNPENKEMDYRTEALLYAASRRQNIVQNILPSLEQGKLVLCDRFLDSSIAYQGGGRGIGEDLVLQMNQFATEGFLPDLTVYFDIPVSVGLERIAHNRRESEIDRLDQETKAFHERVHTAYKQIINNDSGRIRVIDATQPVDKVVADTLKIIQDFYTKYFD